MIAQFGHKYNNILLKFLLQFMFSHMRIMLFLQKLGLAFHLSRFGENLKKKKRLTQSYKSSLKIFEN